MEIQIQLKYRETAINSATSFFFLSDYRNLFW